MPELLSQEVILTLKIQNLLRPVLLSELGKLLSGKFQLKPHILMALLGGLEIAVNHILPQFKLLSSLL